jgi:hypothetical protein
MGPPPEGETPPPGRGWEIRLIWLIFSSIFNVVLYVGLLYSVHLLILF